MWIFLILGGLSIIGLLLSVLGFSFEVALYGLESNGPLSLIGLLVTSLFVFKGIVSYGLIQEKSWAVQLGIIDGIVGLAICLAVMILPTAKSSGGFVFSFRLEIIFLIPYLIRFVQLNPIWKNSVAS